ncbi:MAG: hypothetical protein II144_04090 [Paludibacteraceae bacterium]|nr:hypothetical protein [Paludibacteraceae bacterium]
MKKFIAFSLVLLLMAGTSFATAAQPQKKKTTTTTQTTTSGKGKQQATPAKGKQTTPAKGKQQPAAPASKADYKYAIGLVAGLQYGISLKYNVNPHFTLMNDLSWDMVYGATNGGMLAYQGLIDHLNLAYQAKGASGKGIDLNWYVGGGASFGYAEIGADAIKVGGNAIIGLEGDMKNAPIEFTFDFRPGYGCLIAPGGWGGAAHLFDWQLTLGLRYTL